MHPLQERQGTIMLVYVHLESSFLYEINQWCSAPALVGITWERGAGATHRPQRFLLSPVWREARLLVGLKAPRVFLMCG